jgi:hypothetical protein
MKRKMDHAQSRVKFKWAKEDAKRSTGINFFSADELSGCEQLTLHPGDVLYMPEGTIHSAVGFDPFCLSRHVATSRSDVTRDVCSPKCYEIARDSCPSHFADVT